MRRTHLHLALLGWLLIAPVSSAEVIPDDILGKWLTAPAEGGLSHIEIVQEGSTYSGRIVWLEQPTYPEDDELGMGGQKRIDRFNPDPSRRSDPILGLHLLEGFRYAGGGEWNQGTIYDPNNGKTYKCRMRLGDDGTLHVRGFIGFSLIGRTTEWTRPPAATEPP